MKKENNKNQKSVIKNTEAEGFSILGNILTKRLNELDKQIKKEQKEKKENKS